MSWFKRSQAAATIAVDPLSPSARQLLLAGNALEDAGALDQAMARYHEAQQDSPQAPQTHLNVGNILAKRGDDAGAVAAYQAALQAAPDHLGSHFNLGNLYRRQGRLEEALARYAKVLALSPDFVSAHIAMACTLEDQGRHEDAEAVYRHALTIAPEFAEIYRNLGKVLRDMWRYDEALHAFAHAIAADPSYFDAHGDLLMCLNFVNPPKPDAMLAAAQAFGSIALQLATPYRTWHCTADPARVLRIGFVSGDLRHHAVGFFFESFIAAFQACAGASFESFAYLTRDCSDAVAQRIRRYFDHWIDVSSLDDATAASAIHRDAIDILIDLSGHTAHNRLGLFAWKPCPLAVSWLGYFATTGVSAIDYLIADPVTLPAQLEGHFVERIWRLPQTRLCFTAPAEAPRVGPVPARQSKAVTFGCFNNLVKLNDQVLDTWCAILTALPQSRLLLKSPMLERLAVQQRLRERFAQRGIAAARLHLEGPSPRAEYLQRYHQIDIALDPFPYTGGTTTMDALWMGVPVLTLAGETFLGRQGVGLLRNAGLDDWIAADRADYVRIAVAHAGSLDALARLREALRPHLQASPLFDAHAFAQEMAAALRQMWQHWCARQPSPCADPSR